MNLENAGKWLLILGLGLALVGGLIWFVGKAWPGVSNLPGTLRFQVGGISCVFPLLASILLSVVLTVLLNLASKILK